MDESARGDRFYFFGALMVDEGAASAVEAGLNGIGQILADNVPGFRAETEFHGNEIFHGEKEWDGVPVGWRVKACELGAKVIQRSGAEFVFRGINLVRLRARYTRPFPAHLLTLAHILAEVDARLESVIGDKAIVLADDHHSAASSRRNLVNFKIGRVPGYTARQLSSLIDTMYFGPSHASRLLQATDVATYFSNRALTIVENDPRAGAAIDRIMKRLETATSSSYVWYP
ncbi:DUF3800 domain-containing protein [Rathayibacter agropyri]